MEIIGRVIALLPVASGVSSRGNAWQRGGFVIETLENYPKKICFEVFGEQRIATIPPIGNVVNVYFDVSSHEFEGRWFTSASAFRIELAGSANTSSQQPQVQQENVGVSQTSASEVQDMNQPQNADNLPF